MQGGGYDVVSASGDATLRLIAADNVQPVNTALVPNYADIFPGLKNQPWNTVDGVNYGIPHGRGANLLMYNTDKVSRRPTAGRSRSTRTRRQGQDHRVRLADLHRRRGACTSWPPSPTSGITDPYALDQTQFDAAVDLLRQQKELVGEYWSDYLKQMQSFKAGTTVAGTTWQVIANLAQAEGRRSRREAQGGRDRLVGHLDGRQGHQEHNCSYLWLDHIVSPEDERAGRRVVR